MSLPSARSSYEWHAFTVRGIPVTFSAWWLLIVFIAFSRGSAWGFFGSVITIAVVTISILGHELGHAFAARHYKLQPAVFLHGFGGYCSHSRARKPNHRLIIAAAGPAMSVLMALFGLALKQGLELGSYSWLFAERMWSIGLFLSVLNLMPVRPLDGGHISINLLERIERLKSPETLSRVLSVAGAIAIGLFTYGYGGSLGAFLALLLAWDNAAILHWVPFIPQIAFEPWAHRGTGPKTPSQLPQTTIILLAVVAAGAAVDWVTRGSTIGLALDLSGTSVYPWQPFTQALAPREGLLTLILQLAAIALISIPILRWYGRPGLLGITLVSALASGLVALGIALGVGAVGTSGGTMAIVLCLVAVVCNAGPLISGRMLQDPRTALVLVTVGVMVLRWMDGDLARIPIDLTGVMVGLSSRRLQRTLSGVSDWWKLRNPPPVKLYDLNAEDWN